MRALTTMGELGLLVILTAAAAVGGTAVLRVLPGLADMNERGIKPIACDLCMSFWLTGCDLVLMAWINERFELLVAWMPAFALAYTWLTRLTPAPPDVVPGVPRLPHGIGDDELVPLEPDAGDESE